MNISLRRLFISTMLLGCVFACNAADVVTAEELVKLAPRISLDEKEISSFEVKGFLYQGGIQLRFVVCGSAPDKVSVTILDPLDKTPMLFGAAERCMLYSPITSEVLVGSMQTTFKLAIERPVASGGELKDDDQNLVMFFGFNSLDNEEKGRTFIDIRSLLLCLVKPLNIKQDSGNQYLLTGKTARGNVLKAFVDPSRKEGAYKRIELYPAGSQKPFIVLDEIMVNQPVLQERFVFPMQKLQDSQIRVRKITDDGLTTKLITMYRICRNFLVRVALSGDEAPPEIREAVEKISMESLDWDELRENDKKAGQLLKKIFNDTKAQ